MLRHAVALRDHAFNTRLVALTAEGETVQSCFGLFHRTRHKVDAGTLR